MRIVLLLFKLALIVCFFLILGGLGSCMKECVPLTGSVYPPADSIPKSDTSETDFSPAGTWIGYEVNLAGDSATHYKLILETDNTLTYTAVAKNTPHSGYGTWSLKADTLTMTIYTDDGLPGNIGAIQSYTTRVDPVNETIIGTWTNITTNADSGIINLHKEDDRN